MPNRVASEFIHQSDATILMTVENLIARAMGPPDKNIVDFKIIQEILLIFGRQLRMLEQHVELKHGLDTEFDPADWKKEGDKKKDTKRTVSLKEVGETRPVDAKKVALVEAGKSNLKTSKEDDSLSKRTQPRRRVGSIEVVSGSEFDLLEGAVRRLQGITGTCDMQITARVQATEESVTRMADLLTKLAMSGVLPGDIAAKIQEAKMGTGSANVSPVASQAGLSVMPPGKFTGDGVTHDEMEEAISALQSNLNKAMTVFMTKAVFAAEKANSNTMQISEKMGDAVELAPKINDIKDLISEYVELLDGLEEAIKGQVHFCGDQVKDMQEELNRGLAVFLGPVPNAETVAVLELTDRYKRLVTETEAIIYNNAVQTETQRHLTESYGDMKEAINTLREEKADRDEVEDALRDKASKDMLEKMLLETDFLKAKQLLEERLDICFDKFHQQGEVWEEALEDLKKELETKALVMQLLALRDEALARLRNMDETIQCLALAVGEPYAALITKKLNIGATCATCQAPAKMRLTEKSYEHPPLKPAFKPPPGYAAEEDDPGEVCLRGVITARPPDPRDHSCLRWVGGSHTLINKSVVRQRAPDLPLPPPSRHYEALGDDGKMYRMQEECQPCEECNVVYAPTAADGAGDQVEDGHDADKKAANEKERKSDIYK